MQTACQMPVIIGAYQFSDMWDKYILPSPSRKKLSLIYVYFHGEEAYNSTPQFPFVQNDMASIRL